MSRLVLIVAILAVLGVIGAAVLARLPARRAHAGEERIMGEGSARWFGYLVLLALIAAVSFGALWGGAAGTG